MSGSENVKYISGVLGRRMSKCVTSKTNLNGTFNFHFERVQTLLCLG